MHKASSVSYLVSYAAEKIALKICHIRKGVFIKRIIASHLCKAVGGQQFRKEWRKLQTRIMFECYYSFSIIACYNVNTLCSKEVF